MLKSPMICSLLMAFGLSAMILGCEPSKSVTAPDTKTPPPSADHGSTRGGGAEIPVPPAKGEAETPVAPPEATTPEAPKN